MPFSEGTQHQEDVKNTIRDHPIDLRDVQHTVAKTIPQIPSSLVGEQHKEIKPHVFAKYLSQDGLAKNIVQILLLKHSANTLVDWTPCRREKPSQNVFDLRNKHMGRGDVVSY